LSIVAHLMPGGTCYKARVQRHENVKLLGPRPRDEEPFSGDYFPTLFKR
jgi:hypothetical protein